MGSHSFDDRRFPRLAAYLTHLPDGFVSYADAMCKASLVLAAIDDKPLAPFFSAIPEELAEAAASPLLVSSWMPAVHAQALFLVIADAYSMSDDAFQEWSHRLQRTLLSGPLYRAMAVLSSPTALLRGAERRWRSFHRGSSIEVTSVEEGHVTLALAYPPELYTTTNLRGFAGGFAAASELSRARDVKVTLSDRTPAKASFDVRWSP